MASLPQKVLMSAGPSRRWPLVTWVVEGGLPGAADRNGGKSSVGPLSTAVTTPVGVVSLLGGVVEVCSLSLPLQIPSENPFRLDDTGVACVTTFLKLYGGRVRWCWEVATGFAVSAAREMELGALSLMNQ